MKKFILRALPIVMVLVVVIGTPVFALNVNDTFSMNTTTSNTAKGAIEMVWGTVLTVLQVLAVAAIVIAGVKYMFAGADEKANLKNGLLVIAIGAILVFGASTVVRILISAVNDVNNATK